MLNKATLICRLGKDPEVRRLESGQTVAKFSAATSESYKDKDGNKADSTEWHSVVMWGKLAEIAEKFLKKGMLVYIEGKITYRKYTDKDNVERNFTEIVASSFQMLEFKKDGDTSQPHSAMPSQPESVGGEVPSDDMPF